MNQSQPEMSEEEQFLYDNNPKYTPKQVRVMLAEARTVEQERVVGIVVGKFDEPHEGTDDVTKEQSDYWVDGYNQALTDITEAIRNKELTD